MLPALRVGGVYQARVQSIRADRRVLLAIEQSSLVARVQTAVREGELLLVEVDRLLPEVVLRVQRARKEMPV